MPVEPKSAGGGNLEDSDMKGVSSLLKMKEAWKKVAIEDGSDGEKDKAEGLGFVLRGIDMNEESDFNANGVLDNANKNPNKEKSIDGKDKEVGVAQFSIGDFVWGKIKSHPWWPGQIHDPVHASDSALELKEEGKFLVAYSGDGTFAWCSSSQLRPFADSFDEMIKQSSSRSFINAVEAVVEEIGRFVGSKMTCSCFNGAVFGKPIVINGGLKENACVPDLGIEKLPVSWIYEPLDLLTILKANAQSPNSASNLLEISALRNWVMAFYQSKGVYHFAEYSDPKVIEGLEDPEKDAEENGAAMGRSQSRGPVEEDELLKSCSSGNGRMRKRKQKSITEILETSKMVKSVCKTRKVANVTESADSADAKKKGKVPDSAEESQKSGDSGLKGYSSRERKKSKYLSSPYKNPTKLEGKGNAAKVSRVLSLDPEAKKKKMQKKTFAKNVLSEVKTLGADPDFLNKTKSFPLVEQFLRDFRTSVKSGNDSSASDLNTERKEQKQKKRGRKDKNNGRADSETESSKKRIKKNNEEEDDDDLDVDTPIINLIRGRKKKEKDDLGARLLVTFGQGCPLPSKEDLTNIYGKFGPLKDTDTRMYDNNFCGIVAFERTADAESALTSSKKSNPFGSADVSFVLRCLSPKKASVEPAKVVEAKKTETPKKKKKGKKAAGEVEFVKKKLEDITALLDKSDGKLSKKVRSELEGELKGVLKKVASGGSSSA